MDENFMRDSVQEFITTFDASTDHKLWKKLVKEEAKEVVDAMAALLKEIADLAYVTEGYEIMLAEDADAEWEAEVASDENVDAAFEWVNQLLNHTFVGDIFIDAFKLVHQSNMSKLDDDGKPVRRADGKILKSNNYKPPVLDDLISSI